jgi:N-acetylglutamate synthase
MADQQVSAVENDVHIRVMRIGDHNRLLKLMTSTPGITVRSADNVEATRRYLERNPGLSQIAECGGRLVGCAMAGHDGRRGYLQHVIVTPRHRRRGLGRELVNRCVAALHAQGIRKIHLDVMKGNEAAIPFWERLGWFRRDDLVRYSFFTSEDRNA